ncbi:MAG: heavy-metal-associated domain-containing protein [Planctomycetes bacterium]|nr:heavy-metal-associated domain-containing protein [Planctomycetota bacterium]
MVTRHIGNGLLLTVIVWSVSLAGCATVQRTPHNSAAPHSIVSLGESLDPLNEWFNAQRNRPRFITILSPTCGACVAGAVAVNEALIKSFAEAQIAVGVVWIGISPSDDDEAASRAALIFDDPRVKQFHDPRQLVGQAFAKGLLKSPPAWDIYLFYARGSTWTDRDPPTPLRWMHQLGSDVADQAYRRSGDALSAGLYQAMADLGLKPSSDSPPSRRQLVEANRRANVAMAAARHAETDSQEGGTGACARCTSSGTIGQCSRAGWRYLILTKPPGEGGAMTFRAEGRIARPETGTCMETKPGVVVLDVAGMTCSDCPFTVAMGMHFLDGVARVEVDAAAKRACVVINPPGKVSAKQLIAGIRQKGYDASVVDAR